MSAYDDWDQQCDTDDEYITRLTMISEENIDDDECHDSEEEDTTTTLSGKMKKVGTATQMRSEIAQGQQKHKEL